ncbi:lipid IV(A) 3-deoxy-D-manno-octulosonic acid transferase [Niveibacterium terrae]|uniref:lipid IV(A) 3-deoxy-D-manno-octulosonic acid transferase n=1 Tax=Niveibacterium terrae TaxID=3373598 RepID=UPI003A9320B0
MIARILYTALWWLAAPLILLRLVWRARRQPEYLQDLRERLGFYPEAAAAKRIWIHAVSVGETRAAQPLVRALRQRYPDHRLLLTQMTPTGRATARQLYGDEVEIAYLPYDTPGCVRRFLKRFRPECGVLMETEVWPNLLAGAHSAGVPILLANARLSERSARGYARLGGFSRTAFASIAHIGAQTEADAARLRAAGARAVSVTGNIKYEITPPAEASEQAARFRERIGARAVLIAASTREGEEGPLLEAFARHAPADLLLLLVPRHPQRFAQVAALVKARGLSLQQRSDETTLEATTRVWLGDSMGEMFAYYATADVAIIGGSWEPLGGQSIIEACASGIPAIVGPHTFNFTQACALAIDAGAALRCADLDEAVREACALLASPERCRAMGEAGSRLVAEHRGACAASLELIAPYIRN